MIVPLSPTVKTSEGELPQTPENQFSWGNGFCHCHCWLVVGVIVGVDVDTTLVVVDVCVADVVLLAVVVTDTDAVVEQPLKIREAVTNNKARIPIFLRIIKLPYVIT
jgi:hypothetical protein